MALNRFAQLQSAMRKKQLVRFYRPFEEASVDGYVVGLSPRWLMLSRVEDACRFNGFECIRLVDVRRLQVPNPYAAFYRAALKKRGERSPRRPRLSLEGIDDLLQSAARACPLVTIYRERIDADACHIGRVVWLEKRKVWLQEINPHAKWYTVPRPFRLNEITRVDVGGLYEEALLDVGGDPPPGPD